MVCQRDYLVIIVKDVTPARWRFLLGVEPVGTVQAPAAGRPGYVRCVDVCVAADTVV
jgi:hypothetical protein